MPTSSPSLRSARSISARRSRRRGAAARAAGRAGAATPPARTAGTRLLLAAPDAPAQLVQLRDAETLGVLDQHDGRVRHVDPHLDDRRRDEHVASPAGERGHRLLLLARAHAAVQQRQPIAAPARRRAAARARPSRLAPFQRPRRLPARRPRRPAGRRRRPGDPPAAARAARVGARAPTAGRRPRASRRPTPARQLAQRARRRGLRSARAPACAGSASPSCAACAAARLRPLASSAARWRTPKRCCSSTTATASAAKRDVRLDQRVRADDQRQLAAGELAEDVARAAVPGVEPVSSADRDRSAPSSAWIVCEVLLGERLGRRHQRRLMAVLDRAQHRVQRDDRLAASRPRPSAAAASAAARPGRASISPIARRWSPVSANGSPCASQRALSAAGRPSAGASLAARRLARRCSNTSWVSSSSSNARRRRPASRSSRSRGKCIAASAHARSGSRSAQRVPAGSVSATSCSAPRAPCTSVRICVDLSPRSPDSGRPRPPRRGLDPIAW